MVLFGKWPVWIIIGLVSLVIAAVLVSAGDTGIAAVLLILVILGGYQALGGELY